MYPDFGYKTKSSTISPEFTSTASTLHFLQEVETKIGAKSNRTKSIRRFFIILQIVGFKYDSGLKITKYR